MDNAAAMKEAKVSRRATAAVSPVLFSILLACSIAIVVRAFSPRVISTFTSARELIVIQPSPTFTCKARTGDSVIASFSIMNGNHQPIRLLGIDSTCGCIVAEGLPMTLAPGDSGTVKLKVTIGAPDSSGRFSRVVNLFSDQRTAIPPLRVEAEVTR